MEETMHGLLDDLQAWQESCLKLANDLNAMQEMKNDGRGVSCVKTVVHYITNGDMEKAKAVINNEWDKIRSYEDIAQYIIKNELYIGI